MPLAILSGVFVWFGVAAPSAAQRSAPPRTPASQTAAQSSDPIAEAYNQFLLAQRLEEDNDMAGAVAAYKRAMTLDPKSADIVSSLATLYLRQNKISDATAMAEQALKVDPENAEGHRVLGTIDATLASQAEGDNRQRDAVLENVTKAIDHLEASIAHPLGAPDANTRAMLSRLYITAGTYDKAITMLNDLVKQEPGWAEGATLLVQAYAAAGRSAEAVSFLEQSAPDNPRLYPTLADFYGRQDRWQDAADAYQQALQLAPRDFNLRVGYGTALLNMGGMANATRARDVLREAVTGTRATDQRALYLLAQAERLAGDLDASEATARRLIALNRSSPRAYVALAETLEERQRYQAVIDALGPAITDFRSSATSSAALSTLLPHVGFAYQQLGKTDSAVETFQEAQKLSPGDPGIATALIQAQIAAKSYAAAAETAHAARAQHDDLRLVRLEAQALRLGGKTDQSIAVLQDVLQKHSDDPAAHIALAQGYSDANRGAQAVQVLKDAQAKFPNESNITFELGAIFDKQKRFADAEAAFRQLIAKEPENAPALNYLGYMLADRGERLDESVSLLQRALQIEPENGSYLDSLGWAFYKEGKLELAADNLKRAADRMTTNSVILDHYGDVLFKQGRYDDAIAAWSRALAGDGDTLDRAEVDKKVKAARQKLPKR